MANEDIMKRIEERLTRLEATLSQGPAAGGFTPPGGAVVDPAPWGGAWGFHPRWPFPHPIVDPGPASPVVDPAPFGGGGFGQARAAFGPAFGRIGPIGDPAPPDLSRLSVSQLEASLHTINAEKARLDSMHAMIKQQLDKMKQPG